MAGSSLVGAATAEDDECNFSLGGTKEAQVAGGILAAIAFGWSGIEGYGRVRECRQANGERLRRLDSVGRPWRRTLAVSLIASAKSQ